MRTRVFIIHGWGGNPKNDWLPWLKSQLTQKDYEVIVPEMPDTENPQIKAWVDHLEKIVGEPQKTDIFIGHSIGCQTIWRFLEKLSPRQKIDQVIMIAPWLKLIIKNLENPEALKIAKPWLDSPINFAKVKQKAEKFIAIFSDDDPFVSLDENKKLIEKYLDTETIVLNKRGHFLSNDLPEILNLSSTYSNIFQYLLK